MMNQVKKLSPIDALKDEFMERYGLKIDVSISIHYHIKGNEHLTKELAEHVLRDYSEAYAHYEVDGTTWCSNSSKLHRPFSLSAFYPAGSEENENN